ncbi:ATP-binding cassette domain-containing protein, partial [Tenacibaculum finnmarkense]
MNYLSVEGIAKAYGEKVLFEDISFGINKDQKIAFVAKNGSGKTSILNIVAGVDTADAGQVVSRKDIDIAYLSQADTLNPDLTIEETIFSTDNKVLSVIKQYEKAVENPENADAFQEAFELMEQYNAWDFETQYTQILSKLKLDNLQLKVGKLSGGQKKRLALAIVLIKKPDLLILDEPTN